MSEHMTLPDLTAERDAILEKAIALAPFEGWSVPTLRRAADEAGVERVVQRRAFPKGVPDLLDYWARQCDEAMAAHLNALDLEGMKIRQKVTEAVRVRIDMLSADKAAARAASSFLANPLQAGEATRQVGRTADLIWRTIGDTSADFNWYTKRLILSGVYTSTLLFWFEDRSEDAAETWAFLDRRIANVMEFEKVKAQATRAASALPSPLAVLSALRYPSPRRR